MKISRFELIDRCLFWRERKLLVVGDLHLGYEQVLNERGVSFPRAQLEETLELFEKIFKLIGMLKKIVLLGDVKHYFAGILREEFDDFDKLIKLFELHLLKNGKVIITKGNHDNILKPVIRNYGFVELVDFFQIENVLFTHKIDFEKKLEVFDKKIKFFVCGHAHPAVEISDDSKKERYKCFLFGKWKEKKLIIVPSFFPLVEGSDVLNENKLGKLVGNFEAFVLSGKFNEIYDFGKVGKLGS